MTSKQKTLTCRVLPEWLLVAENTEAWSGFVKAVGAGPGVGGMDNSPRHLHKGEDNRVRIC